MMLPCEAEDRAAPPAAAAANAAAEASWRWGIEFAAQRRWTEAARAFGRAARASRSDCVYWLNLANAQRRCGKYSRAIAAARRCLRLQPGDAIALRIEAACWAAMDRHGDAARVFERLEAGGKASASTMIEQASSLLALKQARAAAAALLRALALQPSNKSAHLLLAEACRERGLAREAVECLKTAVALDPSDVQALSRLSYEKRQICDWSHHESEFERLREALHESPAGEAGPTSVFGLLSLPFAPELHLRAACRDAAATAADARPLAARALRHGTSGKLRLGWVSYDFRDHPVAHLLHEPLAAIDRDRFEVVLYSTGPADGSPWRARLTAAADRFVDLRGVSDRRAAERIRADGVDVLIDLMGHTRGQRLAIFAYRPAPVQAAFLGYPGTTGAESIDYLIGDPIVTPLDHAGHYSEKLAQMPLTFQPSGRGRPMPQPMRRSNAGLPDDAFVICAFNHPYKIRPEIFDTWCAVLHEVPDALLWLRQTCASTRANIWREAESRGVARERVVFANPVAYREYSSHLALADLFVDTWPYNGHSTAADALWAGVPVVTRCGESFASRVAASVVNAAGIGELAFATDQEYGSAIATLATNRDLLARYRSHLETRRMSLPLFDSTRYARELEALLARMADLRRRGLPCEHLPAASPA
jgi:predicted O-linked N-acetylglucosamine transferase (SPINDLY family)